MKCYRVWFMDGSAMLVDAENETEATDAAERKAMAQDFKRSRRARTALRVECMSDSEPISPGEFVKKEGNHARD